VDIQAVGRARQQIGQADVVLLLVNDDGGSVERRTAYGLIPSGAKIIRVWAKADLAEPRGNFDIAVSAANGEGLGQLGQRILHALELSDFDPCAPHAFTARQADLLGAAAQATAGGCAGAAKEKLSQLLEGD
jgi:tRNA U34 5-carboxymethylaminomethyl modifying GTPase MnmE/TrmE